MKHVETQEMEKRGSWLKRNWAPTAAAVIAFTMLDLGAWGGLVETEKKMFAVETVGDAAHDMMTSRLEQAEAIIGLL